MVRFDLASYLVRYRRPDTGNHRRCGEGSGADITWKQKTGISDPRSQIAHSRHVIWPCNDGVVQEVIKV